MESYYGHVRSLGDALRLIEAAKLGYIPLTQRRLTVDERSRIRSGSIFIYNASNQGLKRWTDGFRWSASRFNGQFLTYTQKTEDGEEMELIKKAITVVTSDDLKFGLISYYLNSDVDSNSLKIPSNDKNLAHIQVPRNYYFRKITHAGSNDKDSCLLAPLNDFEDNIYVPLISSMHQNRELMNNISLNQYIREEKGLIEPGAYLERNMIVPSISSSLPFVSHPLLNPATTPELPLPGSFQEAPHSYPGQVQLSPIQHDLQGFTSAERGISMPLEPLAFLPFKADKTAAPFEIDNKSVLPPIVTNATERSYSSEDQRQLKAINSYF